MFLWTSHSNEAADGITPLVSIVVPVRNESSTIEACVESLLYQDYPANRLEVIVLDGVSIDDTAQKVRAMASRDPRVRLLSNPERVTPIAFNRGIRAARGEVVGVMSAHGLAAPDYVRRGVAALAHTGAWSVGGRINRVSTSPIQQAIAVATSSPIGVGDASHNYATDARWVETAFPGLWPRWVFERIGLFDPELVRNQDDELSDRITEAGGRIWYDPSIVIKYVPRGSFRALFSQYRQYALWKVRVLQQHPSAVRPRHLIPAAWVGTMAGGLLLAPWFQPGLAVSAAAAGAYAGIMSVGALRLAGSGARRFHVFRALATLHLAYGIGFWQGVFRFAPRWFWGRRSSPELLKATR